MSWKVEKYGDRPDTYALFDPSGCVATTGTKEQMDAALAHNQPSASKIEPEIKLSDAEDWDVGDTVIVVYWRDFVVMEQDKGNWDMVHGTVISVGATKICHEVGPAFPPRWGGDMEANERSSLRHRSREWCFHSVEEAKKAIEKLPPKGK
jgi:hypothetical protein